MSSRTYSLWGYIHAHRHSDALYNPLYKAEVVSKTGSNFLFPDTSSQVRIIRFTSASKIVFKVLNFLFGFSEGFLSMSIQACIKLSIPPPGGGGNKIKRFGDGEKNQKLEKKKKENF